MKEKKERKVLTEKIFHDTLKR